MWILTENLFGDILSDQAAAITGSLGMLGSATIGGGINLYEPVHGSAPDIAGKGIANPLGTIASVAMLLRHSAQMPHEANDLEDAIENVLDAGHRTADIAGEHPQHVTSTREMGELVEHAFVALLDRRSRSSCCVKVHHGNTGTQRTARDSQHNTEEQSWRAPYSKKFGTIMWSVRGPEGAFHPLYRSASSA